MGMYHSKRRIKFLIYIPRRKLQGACFSALRGTNVQLARAEKHKSAEFCASFRAFKELTSDLIRLVFSDTRLLQHLFPLNAHISPVCIRSPSGNRRIQTKYEHFPSNKKCSPIILFSSLKKVYYFQSLLFGVLCSVGTASRGSFEVGNTKLGIIYHIAVSCLHTAVIIDA